MKNLDIETLKNEIKKILKNKKITYADLSKKMKVSEITIKRISTNDDISFIKLQEICNCIDITMSDLFNFIGQRSEETFSLTQEEEELLAEREVYYQVFVEILKNHSLSKLENKFKNENVYKILKKLEKSSLIELPLKDYIHSKYDGVLTWLNQGPLQKAYMKSLHLKYLDFFYTNDNSEYNYFTSSDVLMKRESIMEMKRDLDFLVHKYRDRAFRDSKVYNKKDLVEVCWLIGVGKTD